MRIALLIPTYNEQKTIAEVVTRVIETISPLQQHAFFVVVIDGNSPDGTALEVRKLQTQYPDTVKLIVEKEKKGIAAAYLEGIQYAIHNLSADAYLEFDGDGQHDPVYIPHMIRAFDAGYDYVIGSRYVPGGSVPREWALYRRILSRFGSLFAKFVLELPINDVTSGLKLSRVKGFAEKLPKIVEDLITRHYAYKIQLLYLMYRYGAQVREVPIAFKVREHDVSKSTAKDIFESMRVVLLLRLQTLGSWKLFRIGLIGIVGIIVQTVVFELLGISYEIVRPSIAAVLGGELAILSNFTLNNHLTFKGTANAIDSLVRRIGKFHLVSLGSICIQWVLIFATEQVTSDPTILRSAYALGIILGFFTNYIGYTLFVWKRR
ncbi:MAG TPA: glycosyltransferase [Candidatus Paceibacterota bacterium]|nr:glycosyltransferase [Candidatus Paceibacterota bacterium]